MSTEAWLEGPPPAVDPCLMPVAHGLVQRRSVLGLLHYAAEHATRHTGQALTTAIVVTSEVEPHGVALVLVKGR